VSAHLGLFSRHSSASGNPGFQALVLGRRFRGDDDFGWTAEFSHSLGHQDAFLQPRLSARYRCGLRPCQLSGPPERCGRPACAPLQQAYNSDLFEGDLKDANEAEKRKIVRENGAHTYGFDLD
jgi:hypothetical protein